MVLVISAIRTVAPRLMTERSRSRSWSTLEISTCPGNETIARLPVHVTGNRSSGIAIYLAIPARAQPWLTRARGVATPGPGRGLFLPGGLGPGAGRGDRAGRPPAPVAQ